MKVKTSELTGAALDWAVAKCEGNTGNFTIDGYSPSTDWSQGGPIIEREGIATKPDGFGSWAAIIEGGDKDDIGGGPTPLIAAMRCYVASKLGEECDIPDELITGE